MKAELRDQSMYFTSHPRFLVRKNLGGSVTWVLGEVCFLREVETGKRDGQIVLGGGGVSDFRPA